MEQERSGAALTRSPPVRAWRGQHQPSREKELRAKTRARVPFLCHVPPGFWPPGEGAARVALWGFPSTSGQEREGPAGEEPRADARAEHHGEPVARPAQHHGRAPHTQKFIFSHFCGLEVQEQGADSLVLLRPPSWPADGRPLLVLTCLSSSTHTHPRVSASPSFLFS